MPFLGWCGKSVMGTGKNRVEKGMIRQFVAMPLGEGYSAEEQINKTPETGGLQIVVYPMKKSAFEKRWPKRQHCEISHVCDSGICSCQATGPGFFWGYVPLRLPQTPLSIRINYGRKYSGFYNTTATLYPNLKGTGSFAAGYITL